MSTAKRTPARKAAPDAAVTRIAFLRAVNVGGRAVVKMSDVGDAFAAAGCANVRTFIQSGNVLFDCANGDADGLFDRIRRTMTRLLGHEPGIAFRTLRDVERIIDNHPFGTLVDDPMLKLYVVFMEDRPRTVPPLPVVVEKEAVEIVAISGREAFIASRRKANGMYGFPNGVIESLGVRATTRNWTTVTKIAKFARRGET
jgi:uncharacterized protein (DUF1697 family)